MCIKLKSRICLMAVYSLFKYNPINFQGFLLVFQMSACAAQQNAFRTVEIIVLCVRIFKPGNLMQSYA